jgi:hypothetical protein
MQAIGANNHEIPHLLEISSGRVGSMIVQLSTIDQPTKYIPPRRELLHANKCRTALWPLLGKYRERSAKAIDGLLQVFAVIDQSVDETLRVATWVMDEIESIGQPSVFARLKGNFLAALAPRTEARTTTSVDFFMDHLPVEDRIRQLFIDMIDVIKRQLGKALDQLIDTHKDIHKMQVVLRDVAYHALHGNKKPDADKLKEVSTWKWIFQGYRNKMSAYDDQMKTAASCYSHSEQAMMVLSSVITHLRILNANLKRFRNTLQNASAINGGRLGGVPLELYIDMLRSSIDSLGESRRLTKKVKNEKRHARKLD